MSIETTFPAAKVGENVKFSTCNSIMRAQNISSNNTNEENI